MLLHKVIKTKRKIVLFSLIGICMLSFSVWAFTPRVTLPYVRDFETDYMSQDCDGVDDPWDCCTGAGTGSCADPVDTDVQDCAGDASCIEGIDDGNSWGLDASGFGTTYVRDAYTARSGTQYLEINWAYTDCDGRGAGATTKVFATFEGAFADESAMKSNDGTEYWVAWSNYVPADYYTEYYPHSVIQFFGLSPFNSWIANLSYGGDGDGDHDGDYWKMPHRPVYESTGYVTTRISKWEDDKGKWVDWVLQAVWYTTNNAAARFVLYKDGVEVYRRTNGLSNTAALEVIIQPFIYNWAYSSSYTCSTNIKQYDTPHNRTVYYDEIRITEDGDTTPGDYTYCNVAPQIIPKAIAAHTYPADTATGIPTQFTATYTVYDDNRADGQTCFDYSKTEIQVDANGGTPGSADWAGLAFDSGEVAGDGSYAVTGLAVSTDYDMRIRYKNTRDNSVDVYYGAWSTVTSFSTGTGAGAGTAAMNLGGSGDMKFTGGGNMKLVK